jgi:hypothetical protein
MREIYEKAGRSLIWLGGSNCSSMKVFELIDKVFHHGISRWRGFYQFISTRFNEAEIRDNGWPPLNDQIWIELRQLLLRRYFSRAWIIQELYSTLSAPLLLCGNITYPWTRLEVVCEYFLQNNYDVDNLKNQCRLVRAIRSCRAQSPKRWHLDALLTSTLPFMSTEPQDKIFALLGLVHPAQSFLLESSKIVPDYELSLETLGKQVTRFCIAQSRRLTILAEARPLSESHSPSWALDVRRLSSTPDHGFLFVTDNEETVQHKSVYAVSDDPLAQIGDCRDDDILRLKGIRLGVIAQVIKRNESVDYHSQAYKLWCEVFGIMSERYTDLSDLQIMRRFVLTTQAGWTLELEFGFILHHFYAFLKSQSPKAPGLPPSDLIEHVEQGNADVYLQRFIEVFQQRALFITPGGNMGLGPEFMKPRDQFVALFGGPLPFILREDGPCYRLIGQCYFNDPRRHYLRAWEAGKMDATWFDLK